MKQKTLKKRIREVIVARNTIEKMGKAVHYKNPAGMKYLNRMALEVMTLAKKCHPLMPYYIITRKV